MKKRLFIWLFLGTMPMFSVAQRSDIYITGNNAASSVYSVNSEWEQTSVEEHSSIQTPIQSSVVSKSSTPVDNPMERDIDEYNRRYSNNTSTSSPTSEITYSDNNAVWVDTVYIEKSNDIAYAEGYNDASQDYEYALRMIRFRSPRLSFHISSPFYWDVVYGSSFYSLYDYYWNMDWYLDPFGYNWYPNSYYIGSPFLYSRIWYNTWYGPWYNSWYNPIYVGVPVYFTRAESAFVSNRSVNTGWSRNLAGSSSRGIRDSFSGVSRNDRDLSSSRPSSTRSIQTDSRAASSRTITDMRPTDRTDRTTNSSGVSTGSSVRVVSPGASSRSNVVTNSTSRIIETEVSTVRSVQSGTTYTRPSSTNSRVVTTPSESRSIINRDNSSGSDVQTRTNIGTSSSSSRVTTPSVSSSSSSRVATPSVSSSSSSRVATPSVSSSSSSRGSASSSRR